MPHIISILTFTSVCMWYKESTSWGQYIMLNPYNNLGGGGIIVYECTSRSSNQCALKVYIVQSLFAREMMSPTSNVGVNKERFTFIITVSSYVNPKRFTQHGYGTFTCLCSLDIEIKFEHPYQYKDIHIV